MTSLPNKVATVFVGVGLVVAVGSISAEVVAQHSGDAVQYREAMIPDKPCKTEAGPAPCYWDAGVRADGHGHSFWLDRMGGRVRVHYLDPSAKREAAKQPARWQPTTQQPYGGCDEAYLYPHSTGARWCRHHGFDADGDGWVPFMDVQGHKDCEIRIGATSYVRCADGFLASS